jgi:hypothetical protein
VEQIAEQQGGKRIVWYLWYQVVNRSGKAQEIARGGTEDLVEWNVLAVPTPIKQTPTSWLFK